MSDGRADMYARYEAWKGWASAERLPADAARDEEAFAIETARAGLRPGCDVLEIGFGEGRFLDWCRARGHRTFGLELIPALVERARARGHHVDRSEAPPAAAGAFDGPFGLIAAFDVFEHLTTEELRAWLDWMAPRLEPGTGRIVARFPNAGSPFGRLYQHGDLTHRSALSGNSLRQIMAGSGLRLEIAANSARPLGGGRSGLAKRAAYAVRDLVETGVGLVYYGQRVPLDPNLSVVIAPSRS